LECLLRGMRRGAGGTPDGRHNVPVLRTGVIDRAHDALIAFARAGKDFLSPGHRAGTPAALEICKSSLGRRKCICLMEEAPHSDTFGHRDFSLCRPKIDVIPVTVMRACYATN